MNRWLLLVAYVGFAGFMPEAIGDEVADYELKEQIVYSKWETVSSCWTHGYRRN